MVQQKVPKEIEAGEQVTANLTIRRNLLRHTPVTGQPEESLNVTLLACNFLFNIKIIYS
jgi:hypothetical protein